MSRSKALFAGLLAGLVAGIAMTAVMLLLAVLDVATPLTIIGDRLSVSDPCRPVLHPVSPGSDSTLYTQAPGVFVRYV